MKLYTGAIFCIFGVNAYVIKCDLMTSERLLVRKQQSLEEKLSGGHRVLGRGPRQPEVRQNLETEGGSRPTHWQLEAWTRGQKILRL